MSAEQLATRIISEQTGIPSSRMRRGDIDEFDFEKIREKMVEIQRLPLLSMRQAVYPLPNLRQELDD
jgi:replicative DNA helicase